MDPKSITEEKTIVENPSVQRRFAKQSRQLNGWLIVLSAFASFYLSGCFTLLGAAVGDQMDQSRPPRVERASLEQLKMMKLGTEVAITLHNENRVKGSFIGMGFTPPEEYARVYQQCLERDSSKAGFPAIGDTLMVDEKNGLRQMYRFSGFGFDNHPFILLEYVNDSRLKVLNFPDIKRMEDSRGHVIDHVALKERLLADASIPQVTAVVVQSANGTVNVPLYLVASVDVITADHTSRNVYAADGLAKDLFIFFSLLDLAD
jgi:hypothetical protein